MFKDNDLKKIFNDNKNLFKDIYKKNFICDKKINEKCKDKKCSEKDCCIKEKPCKLCKRNNDIGVDFCWNCGVENPGDEA